MKLGGQVAVVTGAGRGIGRGIAQRFALEGARVVVATLEDDGREVVAEIERSGGEALFAQTDVADEGSVKTMVSRTVARFGRVDTLVNNAGITLFKPLFEAALEDFERVIGVDLRGVFLCSKHAALEMTRTGGGSIVNISSNHATATLPDTEIYAAAKSGVNGMTRAMALSLGRYSIRVNAILPGFTDTPHYRRWLETRSDPEAAEAEVLGLHAARRIATPDDIARLAVYLASPDSSAMTGAELTLDGGLSARLYNATLV